MPTKVHVYRTGQALISRQARIAVHGYRADFCLPTHSLHKDRHPHNTTMNHNFSEKNQPTPMDDDLFGDGWDADLIEHPKQLEDDLRQDDECEPCEQRPPITIRCLAEVEPGQYRFQAEVDGQLVHEEGFDPHSAPQRQQFATAVYSKAGFVTDCDEDYRYDIDWLAGKVLASVANFEGGGDTTPKNLGKQEVVSPVATVTTSPGPDSGFVPSAPFPISALPEVVGNYVSAAAKAIGCDPSFVALPLLCVLARAIGNRYVIGLKSSWTEPAIIWGAIIGKSGTHKSPALQAATVFLQRQDEKAFAAFQSANGEYRQKQLVYERDLNEWKHSKEALTPPPPDAPKSQPACDLASMTSRLKRSPSDWPHKPMESWWSAMSWPGGWTASPNTKAVKAVIWVIGWHFGRRYR